jgi:hypothetical protein
MCNVVRSNYIHVVLIVSAIRETTHYYHLGAVNPLFVDLK